MSRRESHRFIPQRVAARLSVLSLGDPFHYLDSIDSTNEFLRNMPPGRRWHGALVVAEHQTAGRGRFHRKWSDTPGQSLLFSILLEAGRPQNFWPLLTLGAAVSVCRTLERRGLSAARIRWPNDVQIGDRKLCGILTEKAASGEELIVGVGWNVHQRAEDFPPSLRPTAGSLRLAAPDQAWSREDLLVAFLTDFEAVYETWRNGRDAEILHECRRRTSTLGRPVCLNHHGRHVEGVVMDLDQDGSLVLREPSGVVSRWHSGDVEEIRRKNHVNEERGTRNEER